MIGSGRNKHLSEFLLFKGAEELRKENNKDNQWIELCEYVKKEILEYDDNMKFPQYLALKLRGLERGEHIANNNISPSAKYDDYTLLCAFKICKKKIVDYLHKNERKINDEKHKINLIIKMVEPEINDVYLRLQMANKTVTRIEKEDFSNQLSDGADYAKKTKEVNSKLKNLF